jgi:hypothetical protein
MILELRQLLQDGKKGNISKEVQREKASSLFKKIHFGDK